VELRVLCREEVDREWDVARRACDQCFELGKFAIARAEAGDNWKVVAGIGMARIEVAGIEVAGMGLRKSFSQN
jgi:hypothetical protein